MRVGAWNAWQMVGHEVGQMHAAGGIWNFCWKTDGNTLQGINVSHLGKRKIIFKRALLVSRRVFTTIVLLGSVSFFGVLFGDDGMD